MTKQIVNGYKLQHAIREAATELDAWLSRFDDSFVVFPDDKKPSPRDIQVEVLRLETKITNLQTVQARYNLAVEVEPTGHKMTLMRAVKMVGGAGRAEKMWRTKAQIKSDRYSFRDDSREKDRVYAKRALTYEECLMEAKTAAKWAAALREAIQVGNGEQLSMEVEPGLLSE